MFISQVSQVARRASRGLVAGLVAAAAGVAWAQPTPDLDLGTLAIPTTPASARVFVADASDFLDQGEFGGVGETLSIKWLKFTVTQNVSDPLYIDVDSRITLTTNDLVFALYDNAGALVALDDTDGSFPVGGAAGLSFGSTTPRVPATFPALSGQDGTLTPGVYYLAVVAGPIGSVTANASNWDITTTNSYELGPTQIDFNFVVGNTTPLPPPVNDDCANAIAVTEDVGSGNAWQGSTAGATPDGPSTCSSPNPLTPTRDVWLRYTPSATGYAVATLNGPSPVLTRYGSTCGSPQEQCSGGGSISVGGGTRIAFPVTAGVPVLLAAGVRSGGVGNLRLNIDLIPPPCTLPAANNPLIEPETCGSDANNGCVNNGTGFTPLPIGRNMVGTLFDTFTNQDEDWYIVTVPNFSRLTLRFHAQYSSTADVFRVTGNVTDCNYEFVMRARTASFNAPCDLTTVNAPVPAGTYLITISHDFFDNLGCSSGYEGYWLRVNTAACDLPVITANPTSVSACEGGTAVFTGDATSPQNEVYRWEYGTDDGVGGYFWTEMINGEFADVGSLATISGATTRTLTISDLDEFAAVPLRMISRSCGTAVSQAVRLTVTPLTGGVCVPACDAIDFNNNGVFPEDQDVADFFDVLAGGTPTTCDPLFGCNDIDFNNNSVFPEDQDVVDFFNVLAGGACP